MIPPAALETWARALSEVQAYHEQAHKDPFEECDFNRCILARATAALLAEHAAMQKLLRSVATNWDCDMGERGSHPSYCRACDAAALLGLTAPPRRPDAPTGDGQ